MDTKLQIKITEGIGWYEDKVGEVFDVDSVENYDDGTVFHIDPPSHAKYFDGRRFVREEDCEVVSEDTPNMVDSPRHYNFGSIEVIDFIDQVTDGYSGRQAYLAGNIIKYISRAPHKNGVEDAKKAAWYLERLIGEMEKEELNPPSLNGK